MKCFAIAIAFCATLSAVSRADQTGDALRQAKAKHAQAIEAAKATMGRGIDKAIDDISGSSDLDEIRALREDARAFSEAGAVPRSAILSKLSAGYQLSRATANEELSRAYRDAIADYTKAKLFDQAEAIEEELQSFITEEKEFLEQGRGASSGNTRAEKSIEYLRDFGQRLEVELERIADETTSAKRQAATKSMERTFDTEIRKKTISIRLPVKDVKALSSGDFEITFLPPEEIEDLYAEGHFPRVSVRMSKAEILKIGAGDTFVFTGTPRFGEGTYDRSGRTFAAIHFQPHSRSFTNQGHSIFMPKNKFRVEHQKE